MAINANIIDGLLRCLGSQTRNTNVFRPSLMSSSRHHIQKHKQYTENNLMQYAHRAIATRFDLNSRVSSGDNNAIYTSLKQNIHIVRLS